jgi:hypothetical protein
MPMPPSRPAARLASDAPQQLARAALGPRPAASAPDTLGARRIRRLGPALLLLAVLGLAGCGGSGRPCRYSDMDDQMMSTRTAFLERMAGCPIGGYN